jgi:RNA-binding protein
MLTGKQKRFLRGLGHPLKAVITIGKGDINESLVRETAEALASHELIKVKMLESCLLDRHEAAATLAESCDAQLAQVLGRTFLLYKKSDKPAIELPSDKGTKKSPGKK